MSTFPILLSVCIALVGFSRYTDAAYGEACSSNSDCTAADNTECLIPTGCVMGTCVTCKSGYVVSTGPACLKDFGTTCGAAAECSTATGTCSTTCACASTDSWDSTLKGCYTTDKGFGATCAADTDCAVASGSNGACVSNVCDCAAGYIQGEGHVCRAPVLGESCETGGTPACVVKGTVTGTSGEVAPTCQGTGTCTCQSTHVEFTYNGVTFCSPAAPATLIKTSLTCTAHNACESGMCMDCEGAASGAVCVEVSNAGTRSAIQPALIAVFAFISGFAALLHL